MLRLLKELPTREAAEDQLVDPEALDRVADLYSRGSSLERHQLEEQFSLALRNLKLGGVYKRTAPGRLPLTESAIREVVPEQFRRNCRILDVGASDGITTVELLESLRADWGPEVTAVMTDINFWMERFRFGPLIEYREAGGDQLLIRIGKIAFFNYKEMPAGTETKLRIRRAIQDLYELLWGLIRPRMRYSGRLSLINPRAVDCEGLEPLFLSCLVRDESILETFHCARASNILNLGYFHESQLRLAIANLHAYLKVGGGLVISRNVDEAASEREQGTSWTKAQNRFIFRSNFGAGSEIKELVDSFVTP